jgi:hypothetical protein
VALGLEGYVEALGRVPDQHSWWVLRDLADLAAALPALDHGLSEAILPWLKGGQDLAVPYALLTHPARDAVRACSTEIRSRVPAVPPSTKPAPSVPAALGTDELDGPLRPDRAGPRPGAVNRGHARGHPPPAVRRHVRRVALERAQRAVPGADVAAAALRQVVPLAEQLRDSPAKTLGPERLDVLRGSSELMARLAALAIQERALPGGANDTALRRLAAPALEFAEHVPNLARALEIGVRESLASGLMLVPSAADKRNTSNLLWVPGRGSGRCWKNGTPVVQSHASAVARAAEGVAPGVRTAKQLSTSTGCRSSTPPARPRPRPAATPARPARSSARSWASRRAASRRR